MGEETSPPNHPLALVEGGTGLWGGRPVPVLSDDYVLH